MTADPAHPPSASGGGVGGVGVEPEREVPAPSSSSASADYDGPPRDSVGRKSDKDSDDESGGGSDDAYHSEPPEHPEYDPDEDPDLVSIAGSGRRPRHRGRDAAGGGGGHSVLGASSTVAQSVMHTVSTLGEGVRHAVAHWRVLLFGQFLSFLLAGTGAASATLHFECRLSAPAFQTLFVYFGLALHSVGLIRRSRSGGGDGDGESSGGRKRRRGLGGRRRAAAVGRWVARKLDGLDDEAANTPGSDPLHPSRLVRDEMVRDLDDEDDEYADAIDDAARAVEEMHDDDDDGNDGGGGGSVGSDEAAADHDLEPLDPLHHSANGPSGAAPGHSCLCGLFPLHAPSWAYFLLAFLDVEANYLVYLAFRYTTFSSISLFDALAIPSAMVFSKALLARRYGCVHLLGAAVCMAGVVVNVYSDYKEEMRVEEARQEEMQNSPSEDYGAGGAEDPMDGEGGDGADYPYRVWGDLLAITGGILYGLNDVLVELAVRNWGGREELLSMLGFYGTAVSVVQVLLFELDDVAKFFNLGATGQHLADVRHVFDDDTVGDDVERTIANEEASHRHCSTSASVLLLTAYVLSNYLSYVGTAKFLSVSEAALLNLSLLTGDLWAVVFSVVAERIFPLPLFYAALLLIVSGVVVYEIGPSPVEAARDEDDGRHLRGREIRIRHGRQRQFRRGRMAPDQDDPGLRWGYDDDDEDGDAGGGFGLPEEDLELTEHAAGGGGRRGTPTLRPKGLGFV